MPVYDWKRAAADFDPRSFEAYLTQAGVEGRGHGMHRKYYCIWHDDKGTPNANLFDGGDGKVWLYCHACGMHGDILDVADQLRDRALLDRYEITGTTRSVRTGRKPVATPAPEVPELVRKLWREEIDDAPHAYNTWGARGISRTTVEELGLVVLPGGPHAGRLLVPFWDASGEIVTLSSRSRDGSNPRWLNEKGGKHHLYWTPTALKMQRGQTLVLTEGQSDAIAAFDCGFAAVGAPGSQSFTPAMASALRGYRVLIVGDGDESGAQFAQTADTMLGEAFVERRSCCTPAGDDIASMHSNAQAQAWLTAQLNLPFTTPWKHLHRITKETQMAQEQWLVESWVPGQGVGCIYGESETFKSWLGSALAHAVAVGGTWLGHPIIDSGPAVILDWENTRNDLVDRQRKLGIDEDDGVHWMHLPNGSLFDDEVLLEISLFLEGIDPRFIFFDSLSRAFKDFQENDAAEANRVMSTVMGLCSAVDAVGLVLHHVNKPTRGPVPNDDGTSYSVKNRMRGNTALINACQYAMYSQKGPMGELYLSCAKQRSGIKPMPMEFMMRDTDQGGVSLDYVRTLKKPTP